MQFCSGRFRIFAAVRKIAAIIILAMLFAAAAPAPSVPSAAASAPAPAPQAAAALPSSVDNSLLKYFPPIIDQKGGSCAQASSVGYVFTYEMNRLLDRDATASPANRFSYMYSWNMLNGGSDEGTYTLDGFAVTYFNGIITEADFPDTSVYKFTWADGYDKYLNAMHYRATGTSTIGVRDSSGLDKLKQYLYNRGEEGKAGGIVSFSSAAQDWKFNNSYDGPSETGYHCILTRLATEGGHAMTIVGYDDSVQCLTDDGELTYGAFIAVNSWGSFYHDRGRYYLPYHLFLSSRGDGILDSDVVGVNVQYKEPTVVFKVKLDYSSRNDISFKMGVADKPYTAKPSNTFPVSVFSNAGGDFPMQGSNGPSHIELGLNFTDYLNAVKGFKEPKYFLIVSRNNRGWVNGEGSVSSVELYDYRSGRTPVIYPSPDAVGAPLVGGDNFFGIPTTAIKYTPASPVAWLDKFGKPLKDAFVVRTASGKYAKIHFNGYDRETGKLRFEYVKSSDEKGLFE